MEPAHPAANRNQPRFGGEVYTQPNPKPTWFVALFLCIYNALIAKIRAAADLQ